MLLLRIPLVTKNTHVIHLYNILMGFQPERSRRNISLKTHRSLWQNPISLATEEWGMQRAAASRDSQRRRRRCIYVDRNGNCTRRKTDEVKNCCTPLRPSVGIIHARTKCRRPPESGTHLGLGSDKDGHSYEPFCHFLLYKQSPVP